MMSDGGILAFRVARDIATQTMTEFYLDNVDRYQFGQGDTLDWLLSIVVTGREPRRASKNQEASMRVTMQRAMLNKSGSAKPESVVVIASEVITVNRATNLALDRIQRLMDGNGQYVTVLASENQLAC